MTINKSKPIYSQMYLVYEINSKELNLRHIFTQVNILFGKITAE